MAKPRRVQRQKFAQKPSKVREIQELRFSNASGPHATSKEDRRIRKYRPRTVEDWDRYVE